MWKRADSCLDTSKSQEAQHSRSYGFRGEGELLVLKLDTLADSSVALASIAEASLLEIASRHTTSRSTFATIIHVRFL